MKTQNIIRLLAGLSLLILFCPFFEMCSFTRKEVQAVETAPTVEQTINNDISEKNTITISGWEFAAMPFKDIPDNFFSLFLCFTGCGLSSALMFFFAIRKKFKFIRILVWSSVLLALTPFVLAVILDGNLNIMDDIRYGYPLYIINSIVIIVVTKKAIKQHAI